jgi:hypothetical protein
MLKRVKDGYFAFIHDLPGERFANLHDRWHRGGKGPVTTVIGVVLGIVLIAAGFFLGLVPGIPGIILGVLGFGLIAAQFRPLARKFDQAEIALRKFLKKCRRRLANH